MKWCLQPIPARKLAVLWRDPPPKNADWAPIMDGLAEIGCQLVQTEGFHLAVEWHGRVARFQFGTAGGTAWAYQLSTLRAFLEGTR